MYIKGRELIRHGQAPSLKKKKKKKVLVLLFGAVCLAIDTT